MNIRMSAQRGVARVVQLQNRRGYSPKELIFLAFVSTFLNIFLSLQRFENKVTEIQEVRIGIRRLLAPESVP